MRRSLKFRRQAQTTNDTLPVMSSMLRVLIVYTLDTSIWMVCTMALQWFMIIAGNVGDVSPSVLEKLQLRIMMWLHGFGTFISAIVLAVVPLFRLRKKANASSGKSVHCQARSLLTRSTERQTSSYASSGRKVAEPVRLSVLAITRLVQHLAHAPSSSDVATRNGMKSDGDPCLLDSDLSLSEL